eukprot:6212448-Pleurochrysis_carterae.AAC.2
MELRAVRGKSVRPQLPRYLDGSNKISAFPASPTTLAKRLLRSVMRRRSSAPRNSDRCSCDVLCSPATIAAPHDSRIFTCLLHHQPFFSTTVPSDRWWSFDTVAECNNSLLPLPTIETACIFNGTLRFSSCSDPWRLDLVVNAILYVDGVQNGFVHFQQISNRDSDQKPAERPNRPDVINIRAWQKASSKKATLQLVDLLRNKSAAIR